MITVDVHSMGVSLRVTGPHAERTANARTIRAIIDEEDREYIPGGIWKIRNPFKYAEKLPVLASALYDSQRQLSLLSAKDIAMVQDQKYAEFFFYLTNPEQSIIIECALQALRDELTDGFMRENELLDLDLSDEVLQPLYDKLAEFTRG